MHEQGAWRVNQRNITCGHSNQVSVNVSGFFIALCHAQGCARCGDRLVDIFRKDDVMPTLAGTFDSSSALLIDGLSIVDIL